MNAKTGYAEMRRHAGCVNPLCCSSGGHKKGVAKTAVTVGFPRQQLQYFKKCISHYLLFKKKKKSSKNIGR